MILAEPEKVREVMEQGKVEKASKVYSCSLFDSEDTDDCFEMRLWGIQMPMPDIPTIVVAALAISSKADAGELLEYFIVLLDGLVERGLKIVAYCVNGSAVERAVQS